MKKNITPGESNNNSTATPNVDFNPVSPSESFDTIQELVATALSQVIAIDSCSDENSASIPSTEGQRVLAGTLQHFFKQLDLSATQDDFANVLVTIPGNIDTTTTPIIALMVHLDTAEGTKAVPSLQEVRNWSGRQVPYPESPLLNISAADYPSLRAFLGEDILFGPGTAPIGLDDKVGMAELMTLAELLTSNPNIPHGDILLVFRPDEEIGRMEAVEDLAHQLKQAGVSYGFTIDGIAPFEISIENFNASQAIVQFRSSPVPIKSKQFVRTVTFAVEGVTTHGDTAKEEGHLNALTIFAEMTEHLTDDSSIIPMAIQSDLAIESNAEMQFALIASETLKLDELQADLASRLLELLAPHQRKGATAQIVATEEFPSSELKINDGALQLAKILRIFLDQQTASVYPLLPEHSDGRQGYSNPFFAASDGENVTLRYRLRDFDPELLKKREQHVTNTVLLSGLSKDAVSITQQYTNMGPVLMQYPELVRFAEEAASPISDAAHVRPIRGGTGVDPFIERNIPIANLGTGYWGPESEKELTSKQALARSTLWFVNLVQRIARESVSASSAATSNE